MSIENKRKIRFNNSVLVGRAPDVDRRMKDKESGFYSHRYEMDYGFYWLMKTSVSRYPDSNFASTTFR